MAGIKLWTIATLALLATSSNSYSLTLNADATNFFTQFNFFTVRLGPPWCEVSIVLMKLDRIPIQPKAL